MPILPLRRQLALSGNPHTKEPSVCAERHIAAKATKECYWHAWCLVGTDCARPQRPEAVEATDRASLLYCADAASVVSRPVPIIGIVIDAGCAASSRMAT